MPSEPDPIEEILTALAESPATIERLTAGLAPALLRTPPAHGEWSANELLAHLRACADVWGDCISVMLNRDEPTIKAVNPRQWIKKVDYPNIEFRGSLEAFTTQRHSLIAQLTSLTATQWERSATVTGAGSPLHKTVHDYAFRMKKHERVHLVQLAQIVRSFG